jgi:hypothetical protein
MISHLFPLLLVFLPLQDKAPAKTPTPLETVQKMQTALQQHNLKALAEVATLPQANILKDLSEPLEKARTASDRLDKVVREQLKIAYAHPFAASLSPFADRHLELVEIAKDGTQLLARVRYGTAGRAQEETIGIYPVDGVYRADLPAEIVRMLQKLARPAGPNDPPEAAPLRREIKRLEKVADILNTLADEIEKQKKWTTRETVTLRLLELVEEKKLAEGAGE